MTAGAIALIVLAVFLLIIAFTAVRIVPQAKAGIVERLAGISARCRRASRSSCRSWTA